MGRPSGGFALELNGGAGGDGLGRGALSHSKCGEGGQDEVGALGAALDEWRCEGEDLLRRERSVESLGHRNAAGGGPDKSLVAGLDGEDGPRSGEDGTVRDKGSSAKVGRHTNTLENGGRGDHTSGVGEAKVVGARLDGLDTGLGDGALQEDDVLLFCLAHLEKGVDLLLLETEGLEIGCWELGEPLLVKGRFKPFEREGTARKVSIFNPE